MTFGVSLKEPEAGIKGFQKALCIHSEQKLNLYFYNKEEENSPPKTPKPKGK